VSTKKALIQVLINYYWRSAGSDDYLALLSLQCLNIYNTEIAYPVHGLIAGAD